MNSICLSLSELSENPCINWVKVQNDLRAKAPDFENILFKIHLKRKKQNSEIFNRNTLKFLYDAYNCTSDIRYYNEFLWVCSFRNQNIELKKKCDNLFLTNLNNKGYHRHGFDLSEVQSLLKKNSFGNIDSKLEGKRIGLIGVPIFFGKIHKALSNKGAKVQQIFIPKHPSKLINQLLQIKPLIKIFSLIYKNPFHYQTINYKVNDPVIYDKLRNLDFDIGFHKLNFIIKPNIFNAFKTGLINDHWGLLPFIRGKSTLAYSLLLGFPIIVTTHLVEKGIDSGKLIRFYQYNIDGLKKIKNIKSMVKKELPNRAVDSIQCAGNSDFPLFENDLSKGLTFYEIHPKLYKYIEEKILDNSIRN